MLTACSSCFYFSLFTPVPANYTHIHAYLLISCSNVQPSIGTITCCLLNDMPLGKSFCNSNTVLLQVYLLWPLIATCFFNCQIIFEESSCNRMGEKLLNFQLKPSSKKHVDSVLLVNLPPSQPSLISRHISSLLKYSQLSGARPGLSL